MLNNNKRGGSSAYISAGIVFCFLLLHAVNFSCWARPTTTTIRWPMPTLTTTAPSSDSETDNTKNNNESAVAKQQMKRSGRVHDDQDSRSMVMFIRDSGPVTVEHDVEQRLWVGIVVIVCAVVSVLFIIGLTGRYSCRALRGQQKKDDSASIKTARHIDDKGPAPKPTLAAAPKQRLRGKKRIAAILHRGRPAASGAAKGAHHLTAKKGQGRHPTAATVGPKKKRPSLAARFAAALRRKKRRDAAKEIKGSALAATQQKGGGRTTSTAKQGSAKGGHVISTAKQGGSPAPAGHLPPSLAKKMAAAACTAPGPVKTGAKPSSLKSSKGRLALLAGQKKGRPIALTAKEHSSASAGSKGRRPIALSAKGSKPSRSKGRPIALSSKSKGRIRAAAGPIGMPGPKGGKPIGISAKGQRSSSASSKSKGPKGGRPIVKSAKGPKLGLKKNIPSSKDRSKPASSKGRSLPSSSKGSIDTKPALKGRSPVPSAKGRRPLPTSSTKGRPSVPSVSSKTHSKTKPATLKGRLMGSAKGRSRPSVSKKGSRLSVSSNSRRRQRSSTSGSSIGYSRSASSKGSSVSTGSKGRRRSITISKKAPSKKK